MMIDNRKITKLEDVHKRILNYLFYSSNEVDIATISQIARGYDVISDDIIHDELYRLDYNGLIDNTGRGHYRLTFLGRMCARLEKLEDRLIELEIHGG